MRDHKKSVQEAIFKYINKNAMPEPPKSERAKPNAAPEKDVERECVALMKILGFDGQVYESKAQLNHEGKWRAAGMKFGTCDWQGTSPEGFAIFVEFKAPGKRGSFWRAGNERQQDYLIRKIEMNAFGVVVDSAKLLDSLYKAWLILRQVNAEGARNYLMEMLPKKPPRKVDDSGLFD